MKLTRAFIPAVLAAGALTLAACSSSSDPLAPSSAPPSPSTSDSSSGPASGPITIGSAAFPENELLGEIYAQALEAKGVTVERNFNIGAREALIKGFDDGSINLVPEYTGNLLLYFDPKATATAPDEVFTALEAALPANLAVLDKSSAEDKDSVTVTKATADQYSLVTIEDLKPVAKDFVLGGPPEWKTRANGVPGLERVYGLTFKSFKPLDTAGPLTVTALSSGQVQAANLFTTDPAIVANNFVPLEDTKSLFSAQNVVPLISADAVDDTVSGALDAVSAALDTGELATLVASVVGDKEEVADVAEQWLSDEGLN